MAFEDFAELFEDFQTDFFEYENLDASCMPLMVLKVLADCWNWNCSNADSVKLSGDSALLYS